MPNQVRTITTTTKLLSAASAVACLLVSACGQGPAVQRLSEISAVRLGMAMGVLDQSSNLFFRDPHGCFADKAQYNGLNDSGGVFVVHCRKDRCVGVEVKYPTGASRFAAMQMMLTCAGRTSADIVEHDDEDLRAKDSSESVEYFYLKNDVHGELCYAPDTDKLVRQVNVWSGP
jgi:hypothetical protein